MLSGSHSCPTLVINCLSPSLISWPSCVPTPDGVQLWWLDVITFAQQALSNQHNWHQTANYKRGLELWSFPFLCLLPDSQGPENVVVLETKRVIAAFFVARFLFFGVFLHVVDILEVHSGVSGWFNPDSLPLTIGGKMLDPDYLVMWEVYNSVSNLLNCSQTHQGHPGLCPAC